MKTGMKEISLREMDRVNGGEIVFPDGGAVIIPNPWRDPRDPRDPLEKDEPLPIGFQPICATMR